MWDSIETALQGLKEHSGAYQENYLGFYSSWLGGYFREPWAMLMPIDDHGFHRGDAVFEAVRIHERAYIDLGAHLRRLQRSAGAIGMTLPKSLNEIADICVELGKRSGASSGILRLFVTRGPGGFSPSPAEVIGHQILAIVTKMKPPSADLYAKGCSAMLSSIPAKDGFWSQIKSCNYLQNVLMKQESTAKGFDFAISVNDKGLLCEGATENLIVLTRENELVVPKFDYTLRGTTLCEVLPLAEELVKAGEIKAARFGDLRPQNLESALEAAFVGTTLGVLPVGKFGEVTLPGPFKVMPKLNQLWMQKMSTDQKIRTLIA